MNMWWSGWLTVAYWQCYLWLWTFWFYLQ